MKSFSLYSLMYYTSELIIFNNPAITYVYVFSNRCSLAGSQGRVTLKTGTCHTREFYKLNFNCIIHKQSGSNHNSISVCHIVSTTSTNLFVPYCDVTH